MAAGENTVINATNVVGDYTVEIASPVLVQVEGGAIRIPDGDGFLLSHDPIRDVMPPTIKLSTGTFTFTCVTPSARVNIYEYEV